MTTICNFCNRDITKFEKENERFVACNHCHKFTAKGVCHGPLPKEKEIRIKYKEVNKMTGEKKIPIAIKVRNMLSEGKSKEDIAKELDIKVGYVVAVEKKQLKK